MCNIFPPRRPFTWKHLVVNGFGFVKFLYTSEDHYYYAIVMSCVKKLTYFKIEVGAILKFLRRSNDFRTRVFLAVNASLRWHNNVNFLFLSFLLITSGVYCNCELIKVD